MNSLKSSNFLYYAWFHGSLSHIRPFNASTPVRYVNLRLWQRLNIALLLLESRARSPLLPLGRPLPFPLHSRAAWTAKVHVHAAPICKELELFRSSSTLGLFVTFCKRSKRAGSISVNSQANLPPAFPAVLSPQAQDASHRIRNSPMQDVTAFKHAHSQGQNGFSFLIVLSSSSTGACLGPCSAGWIAGSGRESDCVPGLSREIAEAHQTYMSFMYTFAF